MKYDLEEVFEKINYYKDKAINLKDKELLELLISDLVEKVLELERIKDDTIFDLQE